ncbi:Transcription factor tau subunit sfc6 [Fulvia fulva]|uniref:Transcription factor tau subunit sfc6 n=1 Tax=Passalora fulva TaxID=5499 RepID=A0A9Q8PCD6_PASFU|nr:Transcription factor tau subunit sfc6 [Fulvia fulva]KAK4619940.1 Transcription factor tau subunit sfc6 [Fulvia fulva]KAK4620585.1 Transcription factor tau subunit sfc6 [Fulvia fulva]UJO19875.1 Transcription factor tau subunit sfc6 [Fulvia fulva]WPV17599.1 Transcription factor tau subunit sfc6 [Fulvia fulva]WPV31999.1 Transcription factor tau subunit sfc6 [Fulvia fulva]
MPGLRSSNRTTPRRKYTVDAFEGIDALQSSSASGSGDEDSQGDESSDQDGRHEEDYRAEGEAAESDDDSMSGVEELGTIEDEAEGGSDAGELLLDEDISIADDPLPGAFGKKGIPKAPKLVSRDSEGQALYYRGVPEQIHNRINKLERVTYFFGPTEADHGPLAQAFQRWSGEPCLPSRQARAGGRGGLTYLAAHRQEVQDSERNWKWYTEGGGRELFQQRQLSQAINATEARGYLSSDCLRDRSFVMGPLNQRRLYKMRPTQYLTLAEPFAEVAQAGRPARKLPPAYKAGYILNLGARVGCLAWTPSHLGSKQYLAVSVVPERHNDQGPPIQRESAFKPQTPHESSIQLWELTAHKDNYIDTTVPPQLRRVLCAAMGEVRCLEWCPVPFQPSGRLGLLACISSDGALRVYALAEPATGAGTIYTLVEQAAFEARPPDTVCTSCAWISSSRIVASCANGCIGVWDIAKSIKLGSVNPRPELYTSLCTTYILKIISGYPSLPHLVTTTAMDGHTRLTDISSPTPASPSGTAVTQRARIGQPTLAWHDSSRAVLSVEDNGTVRAATVKRFFSTVGIGRVKSQATCIGVSPCHPCTLIGTTNGDTVTSNPINRIARGGRTPIHQQPWFTHEWREPTEEERVAAENDDGQNSNSAKVIAGKDGLTRITEGFKAYQVSMNNQGALGGVNTKNGVPYNTIFEERTAVTAVAWNPNLHVGGWAAAGMADGLLRIEDLAS